MLQGLRFRFLWFWCLHVLLRELDVHARMSALSMGLSLCIMRFTHSSVMVDAVPAQCKP